ncbi:hypothetical protein EGW08_019775, partial [Elysia chlorotica]
SEEIKKLRKPTGEKDAPGKTCWEIAATSDEKPKNGLYWIDPNGGGISDAFQVHCIFSDKNIDKTQTCVLPKIKSYDRRRWFESKPTDGHAMFAETFEDDEFSYNVHKSQIKFLQYLTKKVRQQITVNCRNMVAVYDSKNSTFDNAITLVSFDEEQIKSQGKRSFRYAIKEDGCKDRSGEWATTVVEFRAKNEMVKRLPILDVGLKDVGGSDQEFSLEVGRACFNS